MGNNSSKDKHSDKPDAKNEYSDTPSAYSGEPLPCDERIEAVNRIIAHNKTAAAASWERVFLQLVNDLKEVMLIPNAPLPTGELLLDKTSYDLVNILHKMSENMDMTTNVEFICMELLGHISPPKLTKRSVFPSPSETNLSVLNLVNFRFENVTMLENLTVLLEHNPILWKVELAYSAIDATHVHYFLPNISELKQLTYLGLRGNRIDQSAVPEIITMLKDKKKCPKLMWIDLVNNMDIVTVPQEFFNLLKQRWPGNMLKGKHMPTFNDMAESKMVIIEKEITLNV